MYSESKLSATGEEGRQREGLERERERERERGGGFF
jgi:hypothetical protein